MLLWSSHMIKRSVSCKSLFTYHFFLPLQFLGQESLLWLHFYILASGSTHIFAKYFSSFCLQIRRVCLLRQGFRDAGWWASLCLVSSHGFGDLSYNSHFSSTEVAFLCLLHCTYCVNFTSLLTQRSSFSSVELYRTSISFSLVIPYTVHWQKQKVVWGKKVLYKGHFCWCCFSFFWIPTLSICIGFGKCFGKN